MQQHARRESAARLEAHHRTCRAPRRQDGGEDVSAFRRWKGQDGEWKWSVDVWSLGLAIVIVAAAIGISVKLVRWGFGW